MPKNLKELREERAALLDKAEGIVATADREDRELTRDEKKSVDEIVGRGRPGMPGYVAGKITAIDDEILRAENIEAAMGRKVVDEFNRTMGNKPEPKFASVRDVTGKPIYLLGPSDHLAELHTPNADLSGTSFGDIVRATVTGRWGGVPEPIRNSLAGNNNAAGGFLIPDVLSAQVLDKARALSVVLRAGAVTIPMTSDTLTLARLTSDATFEVKTENAKFAGSDLAFGAITFTANTVGQVVTASRELAEDAPNFAQQVENWLATALAVKMDHIAINGMSGGPTGLINVPTAQGIGETGSVGSIAWEDLGTAVAGVQTANHQPNAYLVSPTIAYDLSVLTSGDGVNASKNWLGAPPNVAPLSQLVSTNVPDANIVVGDFSAFAFGIRTGIRVEVSTEADEAFERHQVKIKATVRMDCKPLYPAAFHRLAGITT